MWTLNRDQDWSFKAYFLGFLKAYVLCLIALVGGYVVIDSFSNLDEFEEWAESTPDLTSECGSVLPH
jgi:hypothetical protein